MCKETPSSRFAPETPMRENLARFLAEEYQFRMRAGLFWNDLSMAQKDMWREDADRYVAHLAERGLKISDERDDAD